jgi:hypothetical protein
MPKFKARNEVTGRKKVESIGVVTGSELKHKLEVLAKHNKRTLSDFCKIELEKVTELEENKEILKTVENEKDI